MILVGNSEKDYYSVLETINEDRKKNKAIRSPLFRKKKRTIKIKKAISDIEKVKTLPAKRIPNTSCWP